LHFCYIRFGFSLIRHGLRRATFPQGKATINRNFIRNSQFSIKKKPVLPISAAPVF